MTPRAWTCDHCGARFATTADGELKEYTRLSPWCAACQRLFARLCSYWPLAA